MMHKSATCCLALILCLMLTAGATPGYAKEKEPKKEKVAVVNGTVITKAELDAELGRYERQLTMNGRTLEADQRVEMKKKVLDGLVDRELLLQQSKKLGIKVTDTEVSDQIASLKKKFPNEQEFNTTLGKMKLTEADLKTQFAQDMTIKKVIDQEIAGKVTVSDEDVKAFYDSHPDLFKTQAMVRASHILVKVDPKANDADKAKAREKMAGIQKRVQKGDDFAAVAKEVSECPSAPKGGDLDFFQRGQMVKPFEDAAFGLKTGSVSDVVETQFGYHLIKATDKKDAGSMSFDQIKEKIAQHLKQEKVDQQVSEYVTNLRTKATIEIVSK